MPNFHTSSVWSIPESSSGLITPNKHSAIRGKITIFRNYVVVQSPPPSEGAGGRCHPSPIATISAHLSPSIAEDVMPPAYPEPSPQGYKPLI